MFVKYLVGEPEQVRELAQKGWDGVTEAWKWLVHERQLQVTPERL